LGQCFKTFPRRVIRLPGLDYLHFELYRLAFVSHKRSPSVNKTDGERNIQIFYFGGLQLARQLAGFISGLLRPLP
jgi:hypothetical protein